MKWVQKITLLAIEDCLSMVQNKVLCVLLHNGSAFGSIPTDQSMKAKETCSAIDII